MACCKCCCGGVTCEEGQAGKCCCGGAEGVCCQTGERCCDGTCQAVACCPSSCDEQNPCAEGCYCCDGTCQEEPCCDCVGECAEPGWICCDGVPVEATCCPTCDDENPCNDGCQCCGGECIPDEATCCTGACDEENPAAEGCQCCGGEQILSGDVCCNGSCDEENPCPEGCACNFGMCVKTPVGGCCCVNGVADLGVSYPWDCEWIGGVWKSGGSCNDSRCQYCLTPTLWRVLDGDDIVYLSGVIVDSVLYDFPDPWTPEFNYESIELRLEVFGCDATWHVLESWQLLFDPCVDEVYPTHTFSQPWPPPAPCDCALDPDTNTVIEPCIPCPELTATADPYVPSGQSGPYRCNDGNAPTRGGAAASFTAAVDGEWTNLANWEDGDGVSPAGSLPGAWDTAIIAGSVTTSAAPIAVAELIIESTGAFSVVASATNLHCYGAIERNSTCQGVFGQVTVSGHAFVYGGGANNGEIINASVKFSGNGLNETDGVVTGGARFYDTSRNDGAITGEAQFYDTTENHGTVATNAIFNDAAINFGTVTQESTFNGESSNDGSGVVGTGAGGVTYPATFNGTATNAGTVNGVATFNESSQNLFTGTLFNDATFNDSSKNYGAAASGDIAFTGSSENHYIVGVTTFTDSATNKAAGVVAAGTFSDTSNNAGTVTVDAVFEGSATNSGTVGGFATFNGTAVNTAAGVVSTDAAFNDDSIHRGTVTGTATFNDDACNDGGTAGTFVPNPPPSC